jgi:hypothetical protein
MSPRLFCNTVYAWLLGQAAGDPEAREKLDTMLYEPLEGTAAATSKFLANLQTWGDD